MLVERLEKHFHQRSFGDSARVDVVVEGSQRGDS
jgi:hypothetical protein